MTKNFKSVWDWSLINSRTLNKESFKDLMSERVQQLIDNQMGNADSKLMMAYIALTYPKNILEIGCGFGRNLEMLDDNIEKTGIDFCSEMIEQAIFRSKNLQNPKFLVMDACELKFEDKSFDVVFSDMALQHMNEEDFLEALSEMKRVAKNFIVIREHDSRFVSPMQKLSKKWFEVFRDYSVYGFDYSLRKLDFQIMRL